MRHNLPNDIAEALESVLGETAITHWSWWEIAFTIRAEVQKLIDKAPNVTDPIHAELNQRLIDYGVDTYNQLVSAFMTAGLRTAGMQYQKRHQKSIQIITSALDNEKRND